MAEVIVTVPDELLEEFASLVSGRQQSVEARADSRQFVTVEEAADYLGCCVDFVRTLYRREDIRAFRPGRRILIDRGSLDEYIRSVPA